ARVLVVLDHRSKPLGDLFGLYVLSKHRAQASAERGSTQVDRIHVDACSHNANLRRVGPGTAVGTTTGPQMYHILAKANRVQFSLDLGDHFRHDPLGFRNCLAARGQSRAGNGVAQDRWQGFGFGDAVFVQQGRNGSPVRIGNAAQIKILLASQANFEPVFVNDRSQTGSNTPAVIKILDTPADDPHTGKPYGTPRRVNALTMPSQIVVRARPCQRHWRVKLASEAVLQFLLELSWPPRVHYIL